MPPGIPSSHCSAFVYRKPDTNEITAGTLGSKFPQAHAVLIPFPLPPTSQAVDTLLIASVLQLWDSGAKRRGRGRTLNAHLGAVPTPGGGPPLPQIPTDCHMVPRVGAIRKVPQLEKPQGLLFLLV